MSATTAPFKTRFTFLEQRDYADKIEELQRDCNEFRWALATREDYLNELARLTEVRNALVLRMAECESCGSEPCECPKLGVVTR